MNTEHQKVEEAKKVEASNVMNRVADAYKLQTELVSFYAWRKLAVDKTKPQ